jgi:hypothetical protein
METIADKGLYANTSTNPLQETLTKGPHMATPSGMTIAELPPAQRSQIGKWWDANKASKLAQAKLHIGAAGQAARTGGEALLVGGGLGVMHALSPTGLDVKKVPMDALGGGIALVGSVALAHTEVGSDLRNVAGTALGIFAFRKAHDMTREIQLKKSGATAGGGAVPAGVGQKISKIAGEGDFGAEGRRSWGTGFFGADAGAEDPVVAAARYL